MPLYVSTGDKMTLERKPKAIIDMPWLLTRSGLTPSKSQARRMIDQGAVEINQKKVTGYQIIVHNSPFVVRCGRKYKRIIVPQLPKPFSRRQFLIEQFKRRVNGVSSKRKSSG